MIFVVQLIMFGVTTLRENKSKFNALSHKQISGGNNMKLGVFSVSLNVSDLNASKEFYENLGFKVFHGEIKLDFLIMKNENTIIGLFHNMFEGNILTFNPGWNENAAKIESFDDVREI